MNSIAYGLRAEYDGTVELDGEPVPRYLGGLLAVTGADDFDVRAALDAGDGTIVVDETNAALIRVLDEQPALKRVDPPAGTTALGLAATMSTKALREELRSLSLPVGGSKAELGARLEAARRGDAAAPAAGDSSDGGDTADDTTTEES